MSTHDVTFPVSQFKEGMPFSLYEEDDLKSIKFELVKGFDGEWYATDRTSHIIKLDDLEANIQMVSFDAWDDVIGFVELRECCNEKTTVSYPDESVYEFMRRVNTQVDDNYEEVEVRIFTKTSEEASGSVETHKEFRGMLPRLYKELTPHRVPGVVYKEAT